MANEQTPRSALGRLALRATSWFAAILAGLLGARAARNALVAEAPPAVVEEQPPSPRIWPATHPGWEKAMPEELPKPTYAPATLALGITLAGAGIVTSYWVSLAGLILIILGLAGWIGQLK